jgi:bifunctional non-homologous end joining protein LigD
MASRTSQIAQIGKRKIEVSNLDKVLYPGDLIVKAQLIEYYLVLSKNAAAGGQGRA